MAKTLINPASLPHPSGFNHGILVTDWQAGHLLFLAGQTASNAEGQIVAPGDLVGQYEQILRNFQTMLEAAGGKMQDIVKVNIFVRDRDDYLAHLKPLGKVHRAFFDSYYPAAALFEISRFFQDEALIEIEGLAVIGADE
jgi:enamine deaminase RidA (YjgF/YER057c/UK114 family)